MKHLLIVITGISLIISIVALVDAYKVSSELDATLIRNNRLAHSIAENYAKGNKYAFWTLVEISDKIQNTKVSVDEMGYKIIAIGDMITDEDGNKICREKLNEILSIIDKKPELKRLGYIICKNVWIFRDDAQLAKKYNIE